MSSMSITTINFNHKYTHCSKDSCNILLQSYQKPNTEIHDDSKQAGHENRILMLSFWFSYHIILPYSQFPRKVLSYFNVTNIPIL